MRKKDWTEVETVSDEEKFEIHYEQLVERSRSEFRGWRIKEFTAVAAGTKSESYNTRGTNHLDWEQFPRRLDPDVCWTESEWMTRGVHGIKLGISTSSPFSVFLKQSEKKRRWSKRKVVSGDEWLFSLSSFCASFGKVFILFISRQPFPGMEIGALLYGSL